MLTALINGHVSKFYSFAYSLIPDELQAQQLVIDAIAAFLVSQKDKFSEASDQIDSIFKAKVKLEIHTIIFQIGFRRDTHFKTDKLINEKNEFGKFDLFYALSVRERALLYLRTHTNLNIDELCKVVNMSKVDVLQSLSALKVHLEDNIYESI